MNREKRLATFVENPRMVCRNVNVYYGEKHAIKDVSVDIGRNEVSCHDRTFRLRKVNLSSDA